MTDRKSAGEPPARLPMAGPVLMAFGMGGVVFGQPIRFADPVVYDDFRYVRDIVTGDFDGDALLDIAVPHGADDTIDIYFNDGQGGFIHEAPIAFEDSCYFMSAGDVDGDGAVDLVWADRHDQTYVASVWFNDGDGRSGEIVQLPLLNRPRVRFETGDLDEDGDLEILARDDDPNVSIFFNLDGRTFEKRDVYTYPGGGYDNMGMAVGDFDTDGDNDVAVLYQDVDYGYDYPKVDDTQIVLLTNDGAGQFSVGSMSPMPWGPGNDFLARAIAIGDFDGDGDSDLAMAAFERAEYDQFFEILIADNDRSSNQFTSTQTLHLGRFEPLRLLAGDVNVDGRIDLVSICSSIRGAYVLENVDEPAQQFEVIGTFPTGCGYLDAINQGDMNRDGLIDVLAAGDDGFSILENITRYRGPILDMSTLRRGETAWFVVGRAKDGEFVHFLYSTSGAGNSTGFPGLGGMTIDLRDPVMKLGVTAADDQGRAVIRRMIPLDAPLAPVAFQAVIRRGPDGGSSVKTPFQVRLIQD